MTLPTLTDSQFANLYHELTEIMLATHRLAIGLNDLHNKWRGYLPIFQHFDLTAAQREVFRDIDRKAQGYWDQIRKLT